VRADIADKKEAPVDDRQRLLQMFENMDTFDYYQILGLNRTSTAGELRQAFRTLAKKYHPDLHVGRDLVDVQDKASALFMRASEAYATLSNGAQRAEYDKMLREGSGLKRADSRSSHVDKKEVAAAQFDLGMKSYQAGDFWSAAESFTWACNFDPTNARYFYYKGLALVKVPKRGHDAEKSLEEAIKLDPKTDYYIELGNFYLRYGSKALASSQFREALRKDPDSEPAKLGLLAAKKDNAAS
jgi:curved DNA-binding protein CbpA